MINSLDELWDKMQIELKKIDKQIINTENKMNEKFTIVDQRFEDIENKMNEKFTIVGQRFEDIENKINEEFAIAGQNFEDVENKIDILTNVNLAQILNEQTRTRNEINKKLDEYITKNDFEHKRFDYKLAEIEMKYRYLDK